MGCIFVTFAQFFFQGGDVRCQKRTSALNGSQCTIGLHVDDGLVTCTNIEELMLLEKQLKEEFDIEVHKGPTVKYLGMKIDNPNPKNYMRFEFFLIFLSYSTKL